MSKLEWVVSEKDRLEIAKALLKKHLTEPKSVAEIYILCKAEYPLKKSEIKAARKELGVISRENNGVWYWSLPEKEQQP